MGEKEKTQSLEKLGLTVSQANVYFTLLQLGRASAKTISKHAGLARQEIYRILAELQGKGVIERIIATPQEFETLPLEDALEILIKQRKKELSEAKEAAATLLRKFDKNHFKIIQENEPKFVLISAKETPLKLKRMLNNVKTGLDVITTFTKFQRAIYDYQEFGNKIFKKGAKIRLIMNMPENANSSTALAKTITQNSLFEIRYIDRPPLAAIAIRDKSELIISVSTKGDLNEFSDLVTSNSTLVAITQDYFNILWRRAYKAFP